MPRPRISGTITLSSPPAGAEEAAAPILAEASNASDELVRPAGLVNTGDTKFATLVEIFEILEGFKRDKANRSADKVKWVQHLITSWRSKVGPDLFPLVRLLLPGRDTERKMFFLKESKLAKAYVSALSLGRSAEDRHALENWKEPNEHIPGAGDFSLVAYHVLEKRSTARASNLSINAVNDLLDKLAVMSRKSTTLTARSDPPAVAVANMIEQLVHKMPAKEHKWLIRIILKDLKISLTEQLVLDKIHPDAREYFTVCSDIKRVCWVLFDLDYSLPKSDRTVKLFSIFSPMLAHRTHLGGLDRIVKAMRKDRRPGDGRETSSTASQGTRRRQPDISFTPEEFLIEEKVDGERMQVHMRFGGKSGLEEGKIEFKYWSRRGKEYTDLYGANGIEGSFTPVIHHLISVQVHECILDGEMVAFDPTRNVRVAFGTLKSYAKHTALATDKNAPYPCFIAYDILYLKNKKGVARCFLDAALRYRKQSLARVFKEEPGRFELAPWVKGKTTEDVIVELHKIVAERGEGLVLKNPDSRYLLSRREDVWSKIKPEYMDRLSDTFDLIVIGAYWGKGKRGGGHAAFLCGLLAPGETASDGNPVCLTFTKVGVGFTLATYEEIKERTAGKWQLYRKSSPPPWLIAASEVPDQYILPEDSVVLEIKATSIDPTTTFSTGWTLRFPRTLGLRDKDHKAWEEAMPLSDLTKLRADMALVGDGNLSVKAPTASSGRVVRAKTVSASLRQVVNVDSLFEGYMFYVALPAHQKHEMERLVVEHGGDVIQKLPPPDVQRIVISAPGVALNNLKMQRGVNGIDILSADWLQESIEANVIQPLSKDYLLQVSDDSLASPDYQRPRTVTAVARSRQRIREEDSQRELVRLRGPALAAPMEEDESESEVGTDEESPLSKSLPSRGGRASEVLAADRDEMDIEVEISEGRASSQVDAPVASSSESTVVQEASATAVQEDDSTAMQEDHSTAAVVQAEESIGVFSRLRFYLDTGVNAVANRLAVIPALQATVDPRLEAMRAVLIAHGGTVTDNLDDPQLTHIVVDPEIETRYLEMTIRTSRPRYRELVLTDWIEDSIELEELDTSGRGTVPRPDGPV